MTGFCEPFRPSSNCAELARFEGVAVNNLNLLSAPFMFDLWKLLRHSGINYYCLSRGVTAEPLSLPAMTLESLDEVEKFISGEASGLRAVKDAKLAAFSFGTLLEMLYDYAYEDGQNSTYDGYVVDRHEFGAEELKDEIAKRARLSVL